MTLPPVYRDKKQSTKRKQTQIRSVSDLRAAVFKRKKKKWAVFHEMSWFPRNQLSWQSGQCSVTSECCFPIPFFRKIIFNSQMAVSIPRKPVSWRMRTYCTEDPVFIFILFFFSILLRKMSNIKGWLCWVCRAVWYCWRCQVSELETSDLACLKRTCIE